MLAAHVLPARHRNLTRLLCAAVTVLALAALLTAASAVVAGGHLEEGLGEPVPGVAIALQADRASLAIACFAALAALVALSDRGREGSECAALMTCLLGALVCALAPNLTTLFAGLEIGNLGALLIMRSGVHRASRLALSGFAIQNLAALGLLAAAVELQLSRGTTDFASLSVAPLAVGPAVLWALAGSLRLLAPVFSQGRGHPRNRLGGMAVVAVPGGLVALLRLLQTSDGALPPVVAVMLGTIGAVAALGGSVAALRGRRRPHTAGRGLCIAAGGNVIAGAALRGDDGRYAFAAAAVSLILILVSSPSWSPRRNGGVGRVLAAISLAIAGGLPLGFGATTLILELDVVAAGGPPGNILLLALGPAAVLAAVSGGLAARALFTSAQPSGAGEDTGVAWGAGVGVGLSIIGGLLPGLALRLMVAPLAGTDAGMVIDAGAIRGPGGGWSGGYIALASVLVMAIVVSVLVLSGAPSPVAEPAAPERAGTSPPSFLSGRRIPAPWLRQSGALVARLDTWLIGQPRLLWAVTGVAVTAFLFR